MSEIKVNAQPIEIGRVCRATISTDDLVTATKESTAEVWGQVSVALLEAGADSDLARTFHGQTYGSWYDLAGALGWEGP